jgi:hypothetical protein
MNEPIYPAFDPGGARFMTFGQILDRIYRLMRSHLRLFLSVASVQASALIAIVAVAGAGAYTMFREFEVTKLPPHGFPIYLAVIFAGVIYLLLPAVAAFYLPAASYAATQADLGVAVSFRQAYEVSWGRFGRHVWLMVLGSLYILVPLAVIGGVVGLSALLLSHSAGAKANPTAFVALVPLFVLFYLGFIAYSFIIMLRFSLAYPVCVAEGLTAWNSLQRSAQLTRGAKGRIFLVMLVVYAAMYLVNMVLVCGFMVLGAIGAFGASMAHVTAGTPAFYILIGLAGLGYLLLMIVSSTLSYAAYTTALAVMYHDQRRRTDPPLPAGEIIPG